MVGRWMSCRVLDMEFHGGLLPAVFLSIIKVSFPGVSRLLLKVWRERCVVESKQRK